MVSAGGICGPPGICSNVVFKLNLIIHVLDIIHVLREHSSLCKDPVDNNMVL